MYVTKALSLNSLQRVWFGKYITLIIKASVKTNNGTGFSSEHDFSVIIFTKTNNMYNK